MVWAVRLQEKMDELFYDDTEGGAGGYFADAPDEHVLIRMKDAQVRASCFSPLYRKALLSSDHLLSCYLESRMVLNLALRP